jgi:hypothetical protein
VGEKTDITKIKADAGSAFMLASPDDFDSEAEEKHAKLALLLHRKAVARACKQIILYVYVEQLLHQSCAIVTPS